MNIVPIQDVAFDDKATFAMGLAFDQACDTLGAIGRSRAGREMIAKRIIEAAKSGDRNPVQLHREAIRAVSIRDLPMPIAGGDRDFPIPVYALIARTA
jgi:hypothetical protein